MTELGHGHVRPRPDGRKARCGGPALCAKCAQEAMLAGFHGDPAWPPPDRRGSRMDHAEAARRLGVAAHQVREIEEREVDGRDSDHVVTLADGGRWLVSPTVARVYVPEVDDPKPAAGGKGGGRASRATE